jgi:hypothetical protein
MVSEELDGSICNPGFWGELLWHSRGLRLEIQQIPVSQGESGSDIIISEEHEIVIINPEIRTFLLTLYAVKTIILTAKVHLANCMCSIVSIVKAGHKCWKHRLRAGKSAVSRKSGSACPMSGYE